MSEERQFSPDDANRLIPELTESLGRIKDARQVILAGGERLRRSASLNGGGGVTSEYWDALTTLRQEVVSLSAQGIILRDPESGLVDFPGRVDGEEVFLCWRLGEDRVAWWHGPESGFAGRRPL